MYQICDPFWCPSRVQLFKANGRHTNVAEDITLDLPQTTVEHWNYPNSVGLCYEAEAVRQAIINSKL